MKAVDVLMRSWSWSLRQLQKIKIQRRSRQHKAPHRDRIETGMTGAAIMSCINRMENVGNSRMADLSKLVDFSCIELTK